MAEFSPTIVPLGSLAEAAAAASQLAQEEQQLAAAYDIDIGTTMGYFPSPSPDWP
jgi:hypothetical protein